MVPSRFRLRGLSLIEVMLAVVFLGICASSILACVTTTGRRMREVEQREQVLAYLQTQIESLASSARRSGSAVSTSSSLTLTGIAKPVTIEKKVELVSGNTDLYKIDVTAYWYDTVGAKDPSRTLRLTTFVRSPYG